MLIACTELDPIAMVSSPVAEMLPVFSILSIENTGSISATGDDTIAIGSSSVHAISIALTNSGTISGNGNQAVNFGNLTSGANSIANSGTISVTLSDAVRPGVAGTINNT